MQFLARCKLIHEKIPTTDPDEIKKYTDRLNKSMGFSGKNIIRPCDLDPCPMKKEHIKGMMICLSASRKIFALKFDRCCRCWWW